MSTLTPLKPNDLAQRMRAGAVTLVDIREPDEYAREHIEGAISIPLSRLEDARLTLEANSDVVFHCKTGMRTNTHCARLAGHVDGAAFLLEGGLEAWKGAGLRVKANAKAPLEMQRQVQITAGALILLGMVLAVAVDPIWSALSAFVGAGLMFAGISGWCGMAQLLALAPWNRRAA